MTRIFIAIFLVFFAHNAGATTVRIKDLVNFEGVRGNDLIGYGLVVGLNGTGDGIRNAPFTEEIMSNILERLGVNISGEQFRPKNVAAVIVTATLPPFARAGSKIDVTVSAIGDSTNLLGGVLIMTPLNAADGNIYAVAQGAVIAGGNAARAPAAEIIQGVPTSGVVPYGARIEREVDFALAELTDIRLALRDPDFTTAARVEAAINRDYGDDIALMLDSGTVAIDLSRTETGSPAHELTRIENMLVEPEGRARVVVDQRSGTIVMGADVRISEVAVAKGNLTLRIENNDLVSQPNPFSQGQTLQIPRSRASLDEGEEVTLARVQPGSSLSEVIEGLNALGIKPQDMIDILKTISALGALHAELIVQ